MKVFSYISGIVTVGRALVVVLTTAAAAIGDFVNVLGSFGIS